MIVENNAKASAEVIADVDAPNTYVEEREAVMQEYTEIAEEMNVIMESLDHDGSADDGFFTARMLDSQFDSPEEAREFLESFKAANAQLAGTAPKALQYEAVTFDKDALDSLTQKKIDYDAAINRHGGGSGISMHYFMTRFDGDIEKLNSYLAIRDAIVAADPTITKDQIDTWAKQQMVMFVSSGDHLISKLEEILVNHGAFKDSAEAHGGSSIDFNMFLTQFDGDIKTFKLYLQHRDALVGLDPSLTKEQIDTWAKKELAEIPDAKGLVFRMDNVAAGFSLLSSTEGYTVMGALEDDMGSSNPYAAQLNFAESALGLTEDRLTLLKDIKQLSADLLTEYNNIKQNGGGEETPRMKELRLQLGQTILQWEGVPPDQIPQDLAGVVAMCKEHGFTLETNRNCNDDVHNADEWGVNIQMIEGINEQFKAENGELMSYMQQFMKLVDRIMDLSSSVNEQRSARARETLT